MEPEVYPTATLIFMVGASRMGFRNWNRNSVSRQTVCNVQSLPIREEMYQPSLKMSNDVLRPSVHEQRFTWFESIESPYSFCITTIVMLHIVVSVP